MSLASGLSFSDIQIGDVLSGSTIGLINNGVSGADMAKMGVGIANAIGKQQAGAQAQQQMERDRQTRLALIVGAVVTVVVLIILVFFLLQSKPVS
ncbi:MAG: hypothetical protein ACRBFS_08040 [Aureispira sp.]